MKDKEVNIETLLSFNHYLDGLKYLYSNLDLTLSIDNHKIKENDSQERREHVKESIKVRCLYGWDLSETWNLDVTIFKFLLPRLYVLYKTDNHEDEQLEDGSFKEIVVEIIDGFLCVLRSNYEEKEKCDRSMYLLSKYYFKLWT